MKNSQLKIFKGKRLEAFPLKWGTRWEYSLWALLFNTVKEVSAKENQAIKRNKGNQIRKSKVKVSLSVEHNLIHWKSQRIHQKTIRANKFNKIVEHKINTKKNCCFTIHGQWTIKKYIKKTTLLMIASKRIKYFRTELINEVQDLYSLRITKLCWKKLKT